MLTTILEDKNYADGIDSIEKLTAEVESMAKRKYDKPSILMKYLVNGLYLPIAGLKIAAAGTIVVIIGGLTTIVGAPIYYAMFPLVIKQLNDKNFDEKTKIKECDIILTQIDKARKDTHKVHFEKASDKKKILSELDKLEKQVMEIRSKNKKKMNESGVLNVNREYSHNIPLSQYDYMCSYDSYIRNKITNESNLAASLSNIIPMNESSLRRMKALNEAKLGDKKGLWQRFIAWLKEIINKFSEGLANILLSQKKYLEKYKEQITKIRPLPYEGGKGAGIHCQFDGKHDVGIQRCMNTTVQSFDWNKHSAVCDQDDNGPLVHMMIQDIEYDESESVATNCKNYFLGIDKGDTDCDLDSGELKLIDMYNFCYNVEAINKMTNKDKIAIETSTNAINKAINDAITADNNAKKEKENNQANSEQPKPGEAGQNSNPTVTPNGQNDGNGNPTNTGAATTGTGDGSSGSSGTSSQTHQNNSFIFAKGRYFAEDGVTTNTNAFKNMGSYNKGDQKTQDANKAQNVTDAMNSGKADGGEGLESKKVDRVTSKYITVCQAIIGAKCTACEQIAKDYMTIIRAHVKSVLGKDKNSDEIQNNSERATDYGQRNNNQEQNTNNNAQQANQQQAAGGNQGEGQVNQNQAAKGNQAQQTSNNKTYTSAQDAKSLPKAQRKALNQKIQSEKNDIIRKNILAFSRIMYPNQPLAQAKKQAKEQLLKMRDANEIKNYMTQNGLNNIKEAYLLCNMIDDIGMDNFKVLVENSL